MRRETSAEREAWSAYFSGQATAKATKYGNVKTDGFDSKHEAVIAAKLDALERAGQIKNLRYQVPLVLVEGNGKIRPIKYVADFVHEDLEGRTHWLDAKGYTKNQVYRLKKKLALLLHGIEIEEV